MPAKDLGIRHEDSKSLSYPASYIETCFLLWYKLGRPPLVELAKKLPSEPMTGDTVRYNALIQWVKRFAWNERADVLDAEVSRQIEIQAINEKVEMLRRQADLGKMLQDAGQEYFDTHPISSDRVALGAIKTGVDIERNARGIPDALLKVAELKDEELGDIVGKLLAKVNPDEALSMTSVITDTIDAEFKETDEKEETVDADIETSE